MTDLATRPDIRNFTPEEKAAAEKTRTELDVVLSSIEGQQKQLEMDFVKLGSLLSRTSDLKLWIQWDFKSYNSFLESIEPRVNKGRTQLYACCKIAAQLLPVMSEEDLITTGISKASALASAVKKSGKVPSDALLASAKDPAVTTQKLEEMIGGELGSRDDIEVGTWYSLVGVFFSESEREEFERIVKRACHVDPPLKHEINWRDASAVDRKEVLQRLTAEFWSTYGGE